MKLEVKCATAERTAGKESAAAFAAVLPLEKGFPPSAAS